MNEQRKSKRRSFDPESLGIWEGCHGEFFASGVLCRHCGKTRADHLSGGLPQSKPQRDPEKTLELYPKIQKPLLQIDGACRVVITRGYGPAGPLDHDNFVGGLKHLRDQITEKILLRSSDAESDGLLWEYRQEPGQGLKVEIFEK